MNLEHVALGTLVLAAIPAALFLVNLLFYRLISNPKSQIAEPISVLIPARNEEKNIRATLEAVLANCGTEFEVIVLDDQSTDRTAAIVEGFARGDSRVRLESAPALPPGWCGKQHACHVLARISRNPLLMFIDADVRLAPDALSRMASFMKDRRDVALASGVPYQELGTLGERLLLPLIHFVLLGYLPMAFMRWTRLAGFSAGCGQLFIARADTYRATGGHAMIRATLHDGVKLPRLFRRAGYRTDLFDATDLATCRMYQTNGETWRGLGKNATEGLGAPGTILPMTALLLGGQVLPFVLLAFAPLLTVPGLQLTIAAVLLAYLPRLVAVARFRQPIGSALLHPLGVLALLAVQWGALAARTLGRPSQWKGRDYHAQSPTKTPLAAAAKVSLVLALATATITGMAAGTATTNAPAILATNAPCTSFSLRDQFDALHLVPFPRTNLLVLTIADRKGNDQIDGWLAMLTNSVSDRVALEGVADVSAVPAWLRGMVQRKFRDARPHPVMLDWSGGVVGKFPAAKSQANVFLIDREGRVLHHVSGPASEDALAGFSARLKRASEEDPVRKPSPATAPNNP